MEKHKVGPRSISKSPIRSPRRVTPPPLVARVRVAVRVRPPLSTDEPPQLCIAQAEADSTTGSSDNMLHFQLEKTQKCFRFDHVFLKVYNAALQPLLASLLHGFNVTVLAYGQTGSGKTYTMGGATRLETAFDSSEGLIPHFLRDLFEALRNEASMKTTAKVSFLEIYCDEIRDLLVADGDTTRSTAHNNPRQNSATRLTIHEDDQDVWVEELNQVKVKNVGEAVNLLKAGRQRQTIGAHALNDHSSRSHAVYTLEVSRVFADEVKRAKLTFVDLAGSERVKKTLMEGQGMKEGSHINIGLLALGNVINALGSKQRILQRRNSTGVSGRRSSISASDNITPLGPAHVPYRSSKLTRLLRDALGGNSVTLFIACISPDATNGNETLCTLQYANRARSIQNKAHKNVEEAVPEDITDDEASVQHGTESEREIYALREQSVICPKQREYMVGSTSRMTEAALSVSLSPLLPSSVEDETPPGVGRDEGGKRVRFQAGFQPTHTVFTPRLSETSSLRYRKPDDRVVGSTSLAPPSSVSSIAQPNYDDFLRRVSVVLYQHIRRCEKRHREQQPRNGSNGNAGISSAIAAAVSALTTTEERPNESRSPTPTTQETATFNDAIADEDADADAADAFEVEETESREEAANPSSISSPRLVDLPVEETFREEHFVTPQYRYTFVRLPRVHPLTVYRMEKITSKRHVPSVDEIFRFCKNLFNKAQLSAECTIVCLIYIERLMEQANVPLLAATWRPIVVCGLLLASKVWQDLSSWNVEISNIYPQFSLHSINRLERLFLHHIQWDLYISATVYAKYYFALRSLTEKKDFRRRTERSSQARTVLQEFMSYYFKYKFSDHRLWILLT
ncbi:cyclin-Y-like protein [Phytophthora cinnamomi]|uniref:cyclin-Y-like protein n=1 Tax=Phytophthora cinnamomi TaxID=4785 RepID=UPI00355992FC|nr:cyclin-Y-like protein [Phytophthora cinnamomi]